MAKGESEDEFPGFWKTVWQKMGNRILERRASEDAWFEPGENIGY
jgi:hypothetical protein